MKLPILAYGHTMLRQPAKTIDKDFPGLIRLIENMWETMYHAGGCGLAAPQVGQAVRIFIVDSKTTYLNLEAAGRKHFFDTNDQGIKETFMNAQIIERSPEVWADSEGCLSIPGITREIIRPWSITMQYDDINFEKQISTFSGATARMVQHEYDHTEGRLYLDYLDPSSRKLLNAKLKKISRGQVACKYSMRFI